MHEVTERVKGLAELFRGNAAEAEQLGRLPDASAQALRDSGVIRMLQPKGYNGYETHPNDFFEAVLEVGRNCGSSGWVAGVVGVHTHELAQADPKLQEEVWGEDPDTWVASPYAPMGTARPVDGGYVFNGHWTFSSGTDHCQWVMIGGKIAQADGSLAPDAEIAHFVLPRPDYEIVEGSWEVMGLRGTGSKDLLVKDAFVPEYRVIRTDAVMAGTRGREIGLDNPLYSMPRAAIFSGVITAGTLALCQGVLDAYVDHTRNRITRTGRAVTDPYQTAAFAEAASDIQASIQHFLWDIGRVYDHAASGQSVPLSLRAEVRRNQVTAANRAVEAADKLFIHAGGSSLKTSLPLQRFWRDAHAARQHANNSAEPILNAYGLQFFGQPIPPGIRI
jgi:3-hydroxy-9,10-secoandrosta-1,3,5(10)-triene-9,17-dione monooxygenase